MTQSGFITPPKQDCWCDVVYTAQYHVSWTLDLFKVDFLFQSLMVITVSTKEILIGYSMHKMKNGKRKREGGRRHGERKRESGRKQAKRKRESARKHGERKRESGRRHGERKGKEEEGMVKEKGKRKKAW